MAERPISQTSGPKSILVVDDELTVGNTLRLLLELNHHRVEVAGNGEEALAMFDRGNYDLIITDYLMPGLDGLRLARMIKERSPKVPIVLVSGVLEELENKGVALTPFDTVLAKPFSLQQLEGALMKVFPNG